MEKINSTDCEHCGSSGGGRHQRDCPNRRQVFEHAQPSLFDAGVPEDDINIVRVIRGEDNFVKVYECLNARRLKYLEGDFDAVKNAIKAADNWGTEYFIEKKGRKIKVVREDFYRDEKKDCAGKMIQKWINETINLEDELKFLGEREIRFGKKPVEMPEVEYRYKKACQELMAAAENYERLGGSREEFGMSPKAEGRLYEAGNR